MAKTSPINCRELILTCSLSLPHTPLGECGKIDVHEVFVQGSSDAMLMAWNVVDSYNKSSPDSLTFDPVCCTEGVEIPRLGFVDDLLELSRSVFETQVSCVSDEVFENQHRIDWKPIKCKVMPMNIKIEEETIMLNEEYLEIVCEHKYLGTLVADKGRVSDMHKRINDSKGVLNEIVEIFKSDAVGAYRFKYMFTLLNSCFLKKFKHGCEVWDSMCNKDRDKINRLVPQTIKRILELPRSTPTNAIRHDFGLIQLQSEVEMEKILFTVKVMEMDNERIAKRLLTPMMSKSVPGYCSHVDEVLNKFQITIDNLKNIEDKRKAMQLKVIEYEKEELLRSMLCGSKTDAITFNYKYNGAMLPYLCELPFVQSRIIFVFRCRMFPTRVNFPERWNEELKCVFCKDLDTDEHLFTCWGYLDIIGGDHIDVSMFYNLNTTNDELSRGADILIKIYDRLEIAQNDSEL